MEKTKKIIFVSHCILNQNVMPMGKEKFSGPIKELLEMFSEAGVGVVQMPCPELDFSGQLQRKSKLKEVLDNKNYRKHCRESSKLILSQIEKYLSKNYNVLGILGIEMSPTCAVHQIENGHKAAPGKGIFIEELEGEMHKKNFQVPILGVNLNNIYNSMEKVQSLLKYS